MSLEKNNSIEEMRQNQIDSFLRTWSEQKNIDGKSFDELFNIDGISLWWFFKRFFLAYVMPKQINTFEQMYAGKKLTQKERIKLFASSKLLSKYLNYNEDKKIKHYKKIKKLDYNPISSTEKKILFITYSNHIDSEGKIFRLQSIIDLVKKENKIKERIVFVEPLSSGVYKKTIAYPHLYRYFDEAISEKAKKSSEEFSMRWKQIDNKTKSQMIKLDEKSLWPYLKYAFDFFMSQEFLYTLFLQYELTKKIIEIENITAIVLTSANGLLEKCIMVAANQQGKSCLVIQHGTGKLHENTLPNPELIDKTKLLVFSEFYKKRYVQSGMKEGDVIVVGPVIFDEIKSEKNYKKIGLINKVLFATSPLVEDNILTKEIYFDRIAKILSDLKTIKDLELILKLHPRERNIERYKTILTKLGYSKTEVVKDISRKEFYKLIKECNSFLNLGSTAAMEACIINKPVVTVNILDCEKTGLQSIKTTFIEDSEATINVNYTDDVVKAVERSFKDEEEFKERRKEFVEKICYKVDGKASERIVDFIYNEIGNQNKN
ncbi:MAG: UDP-N-acetylglucosamine 2-epimerase [Nanoarchaeota archaeon]